MGINQALAALDEAWDDVRRTVDPETFERVRQLTIALHEAAAAGNAAARGKYAYAIAEVLSTALAPGHPFMVALDGEDTRYARPADQKSVAERLFAHLSDHSQPAVSVPSAETAAAVAAKAERWLAKTPCVQLRQLRAADVERSGNVLISFGPDGRLPRFQFDAALRPRQVVLTINAMLDASRDPWGVADWWLGRNAWLGDAPAVLLGAVEDSVLVHAAEAELGEV